MPQTDVLSLHLQVTEEDILKGKYLLFSIENEMYGMELRYITEIIGIQPFTGVYGMPEYVKGVTNLRGKIIPVIDARLRFKKAVREYDDRTCIIVTETNDISIGLVVDTVSEVISILDDDIAPLPDINNDGRGYIKGIGKTGGDIKLLLDCQRLLSDKELEALSIIH